MLRYVHCKNSKYPILSLQLSPVIAPWKLPLCSLVCLLSLSSALFLFSYTFFSHSFFRSLFLWLKLLQYLWFSSQDTDKAKLEEELLLNEITQAVTESKVREESEKNFC